MLRTVYIMISMSCCDHKILLYGKCTATYLRLLELVGFDAAHKEWLAGAQCLHEQVERGLELSTQRRRLLARFRALCTCACAEEQCERACWLAVRVYTSQTYSSRVLSICPQCLHVLLIMPMCVYAIQRALPDGWHPLCRVSYCMT